MKKRTSPVELSEVQVRADVNMCLREQGASAERLAEVAAMSLEQLRPVATGLFFVHNYQVMLRMIRGSRSAPSLWLPLRNF